MPKKLENVHETVQNKSVETQTAPSQSPTANTVRKRKPKKNRKVKFADPLAEQRLYDRALSPNAEPTATKFSESHDTKHSPLSDLQPPLSLVASLDLAAQKLNARATVTKTTEDKDLSLKTIRSIKSIKSTKSVAVTKEPKSPAKKSDH